MTDVSSQDSPKELPDEPCGDELGAVPEISVGPTFMTFPAASSMNKPGVPLS